VPTGGSFHRKKPRPKAGARILDVFEQCLHNQLVETAAVNVLLKTGETEARRGGDMGEKGEKGASREKGKRRDRDIVETG
jgi:hypothetical protein